MSEGAPVYFQNPTLEHYTSYQASELKTAVLALEDLQLNTNGCSLIAIREKYRQQKVTNVHSDTVCLFQNLFELTYIQVVLMHIRLPQKFSC